MRITILERSAGGGRQTEVPFEVPAQRMTLRELMRRYIHDQVEAYNSNKDGRASSWFAPAPEETELNPVRRPRRARIDPEMQCAASCAAFERNQIIVLINGVQAEDLEAEIVVSPDTKVTFLKLTPLVGG